MLEKLFNLRAKNDDKIIFLENGIFYYCFEEDAYILSYLLGYKLNNYLNKECSCFPKKSINKVGKLLKNNDIGFIIENEISYGDSIKYYEFIEKGRALYLKLQYIEILKRKLENISIESLKDMVSMLN